MLPLDSLSAQTIRFRLAMPADAAFIHSLRSNERYNQHLSQTQGGEIEQRLWLENYKQRELDGKEYYFIIERIDGVPIGTVRLYDFRPDINSFCWGSWILNEHKTSTAAIESTLLVYHVGFYLLAFAQSHFDVRLENQHVIRFHLKTGAMETHRDEQDVFFVFNRDNHQVLLQKFGRYLSPSL
ncbi:GNAT family N-acetyltransferase [Aeromonas rivipollensis]|uniref:GNAT family N-acetyltransferase n=1 Tax=Aeromonas rivipollensis TaxID=948519 RepID=UPI000F9EC9A9|nr:GNAT family N-acetyltransferase [Aeromonas rivipollensis]